MISIFGIVLIGILINLLLKYKSIKDIYIKILSLTISFELFLNYGYFLKLGGYEFLYNEVLVAILLLISLFMLRKIYINKKILMAGSFFFVSLLITEVLLILNPYDKELVTFETGWINYFSGVFDSVNINSLNIAYLIRFLLILIIGIVAVSIIKKEDMIKMSDTIIRIGCFVITICIIESVIKNFFPFFNWSKMLNYFFGEGHSTVDTILSRGNIKSINGLMREPSQLGEGMFYFGIIILMSNKDKKVKNIIISILSIVLIISGSLRGALLSLILISILLINNFNISYVFFITLMILPIFISVLMSLEITNYYIIRIITSLNLIKGKISANITSSEAIRITSVVETIKIFFDRYLFGIGLGQTYAFGFLPSMLASLGSVGVISWFNYLFIKIGRIKLNKTTIAILLSLISSWMLMGAIGTAYSINLLYICLQFRYYERYAK